MSRIERRFCWGLSALIACAACDSAPMDGLLYDRHNYAFSGALEVPSVLTAEGADLEICWDGLQNDLRCQEMDPVADIDNVSMVRFPYLDEAAVETGMSDATLQQADISGYVESRVGTETCTSLSDMSFFGTSLDVTTEYHSELGTYLLILTTGVEPAMGSRMLTFIQPSPGSDNVRVDISGGCDVLEFSANLRGLEPVVLPVDGPWVLDWSAVTKDGRGNLNNFEAVDTVTLAYYDEQSLTDLEADFLNIEAMATSLWSAPLESGSAFDLELLSDAEGAFPGFQEDGLWVFALLCERCFNPAPLFLTRIEAR